VELDPWVRREKHATLGANVVVELHGKRISDGGGLDSAQPAPVTRLCDSECGQGTRWSGSNIHSRPQRTPTSGSGSLGGRRRPRVEHDPRRNPVGQDIGEGLIDRLQRAPLVGDMGAAARVQLEHLGQIRACARAATAPPRRR
jgi:hypothetical protein